MDEPIEQQAPIKAEEQERQRRGLLSRAYSEEGKQERLVARLDVRIKPTTIARLRLFSQDLVYATPLIDEVVDEALHDYLIRMGY
ncbi:MAG TPA: hypothetical protein VEL31_31785 [Ktedonobacteraceae bacterium]|nr:hypothetical protein [Ktedonobacteraceae bacterium]